MPPDAVFDLWMFLAGLAIFIFGMNRLESGVKGFAGKSFRNLLQRYTNKSWKGIFTGTLFTIVLQSSTMVSLLVLAFLGAGMLTLKNGLGVILGANLGTTFSGWVIATLGFKIDIADFSYPFIVVGILLYLLLYNRPVLKNIGSFLLGFGFLFLGLDYMKDALDTVAGSIDISMFSQYGLWAFFILGLIITALIQSSSAMVVILLSTLNAGLLDIYQATAMLIGANIGTTTTMAIAAIGSTADKKRLALFNLLFNIITCLVVFALLKPLLLLISNVFYVKDALLTLVSFHTLLNIIGIVLFLPFLGLFEKFLQTRFKTSEPKGDTMFIKRVSAKVPEAALKAMEDELKQVYMLTRNFINDCLGIDKVQAKSNWKTIFTSAVDLNEKYEKIKYVKDDLTAYYAVLQDQKLEETEYKRLTANMMSLRFVVFAAKDIKDVMHNFKFVSESEDVVGTEILNRLRAYTKLHLNKIDNYLYTTEIQVHDWHDENNKFYEEIVAYLYQNSRGQTKKEVSVSTLTNMIKQTVSAVDNLYHAFVNDNNGKETAAD